MNFSKLLPVLVLVCLTPAAGLAQTGKDFHDQTLKDKNFAGAALDGADFSDATVKECNFAGASLKGAVFKDAILSGGSFTNADLTGADLRGITGGMFLSGANLTKANLEGLDCGQLSLYKVSLKETNLRDTKNWGQVAGCDFYRADVRGANLRGLRVTSGNLAEIRFKGAVYDEGTSWPDGFDPKAAGAVLAPVAAAAPKN